MNPRSLFREAARHRSLAVAGGRAALIGAFFAALLVGTAAGAGDAASPLYLITRHRAGMGFDLPAEYGDRIRSVHGVKHAAGTTWFGGALVTRRGETVDAATIDRTRFFANVAVEAQPFFRMHPEFAVPDEQWRSFLATPHGCIIGRKLAEKLNWRIGTQFLLESLNPSYRSPSGPFEFVVSGIYDTDLLTYPGTDRRAMFFHIEHLRQGLPHPVGVESYTAEIDDPALAMAVSQAIDALFAGADAQTRTAPDRSASCTSPSTWR